MPVRRLALAAALFPLPAFFLLIACSSTTIALKEKLGIPKRDQLVARVKDARDDQEQAKQQFASALDQFLAVTGAGQNTSVAELEKRYDALNKEYNRCESQAADVRKRITDVQNVAEALFKEWKAELAQYSSPDLRSSSQKQLDQTRAQYDRLLTAMNAAAKKMDPVLAAFKDQVLFLKHNLNARAIASLQTTSDQMQTDIAALIKQMEASIAEANSFIQQMQSSN